MRARALANLSRCIEVARLLGARAVRVLAAMLAVMFGAFIVQIALLGLPVGWPHTKAGSGV